MSDRRTVWKAHMTEMLNDDGVYVYVLDGQLSECGQWVEIGADTRVRRTDEWRDSPAEARLVIAGRVAEIGSKIVRQSQAMKDAAAMAAVEC